MSANPQFSAFQRPATMDFYRPVHAILGLPVDAVTPHAAQERIYTAVITRRPCFLSTPNLNFAIASLRDREFRDSVIHSNLSVADGMPLVWIAKLFGMPIRERVTGSGLFEQLQRQPDRIVSVYFFGGPGRTAAAAAERINSELSGLHCVGSHSPGFGSVEELSHDTVIQDINDSRADFLVVALGAKKGQAWIERNRSRLRVPVSSHLGAVVNFAAGSVRRAPPWMQNLGLEWLWRIKEEPGLWKRYWRDGSTLLRLMFTRLIPGALHQRLFAPRRTELARSWVSISGDAGCRRIKPYGAWREWNLIRMRRTFEKTALQHVDVVIDLSETTYIDSAFIGLLMLMYGHQSQSNLGFRIQGTPPRIRRMFKNHCAEFLLDTEVHAQSQLAAWQASHSGPQSA